MRQSCKIIIFVSIISLVAPLTAMAAETLQLNAVTFPERKTIRLEFRGTARAPRADINGKVEFHEGQAQIEIEFDDMKPAVLFGGDITCYVVWAVSRDGTYSNLGELWMPKNSGNVDFSSGRKSFALLITAEPYALVNQPSELVMMFNAAAESKKAPTDVFAFTGLGNAPDHELRSIANVAWDSERPLDLMQAEKAYELAQGHQADTYAPSLMRDARIALGQARNLRSKDKARIDYSRRSIALSSDSIRVTLGRKEAEELERQIAERRAEMSALEGRAQEAEERSAAAWEALSAAQIAIAEANRLQIEAAQLQDETEASVRRTQAELAQIGQQKNALELEQAAMIASMAGLRKESKKLRKEREELSGRLEGALSQVAETRDSARGLIVNLPDILFDLNKAALKPETQIVIAKLSGILLMMPDLNVRVEGHTDATGTDGYNLTLSEERAQSVSSFLESHGIDSTRLQAVGYGKIRPVADNETAEGRKKNRRVEIIIARGEIAGEEPTQTE
ncbi:MAG: hypothetical protein DRJ65_21760 [Acidobacteria bacterium]|nr:MAG: hypothetical protein DRJ65_21760 [Acidobacteriota bacterium]